MEFKKYKVYTIDAWITKCVDAGVQIEVHSLTRNPEGNIKDFLEDETIEEGFIIIKEVK